MLLVFALAIALWSLGALIKIPNRNRWMMIGTLYFLVLAVHFILPKGHQLRMLLGETEDFWLIVGGFALLIFSYLLILRQLRSRANAKEVHANPAAQESFTDTELNRYARHIVLREIGGHGQKALKNARVLVIGAGGLGSPVLQYLSAAGVGTIGVIDDDVVDGTNLHRQVIHQDKDIGIPKVFSAKAAMEAQNPFVAVQSYNWRLTANIADDLIKEYDLVLDGTDNFETRYIINAITVARGVPLISGALSQWEGQLSIFDPARGAPCYRCIFPKAPEPEMAPNCAATGVVGPLPGIIGAMMAVEAIKVITGSGATLRGELLIHDALYGENRKIVLKRRANCETCAHVTINSA